MQTGFPPSAGRRNAGIEDPGNARLRSLWGQYYNDPVRFTLEVTQLRKLDPWQQEALTALANNSLVAVAGGTGIGKETVAASALIWFLMTRPFAKVSATSASAHQITFALWQEIHKLISGSKYLPQYLEWTPSKILVRGHEERWSAFQSVAAKRISAGTGDVNAEGGAGIHEKHVLIIISEASGVDDAQWDAKLLTLTGGADNRCLAIGNPVRRSGRFFEIFSNPAWQNVWWTRNVSHLESSFTNRAASERFIATYGEDSPIVQSKIFGQFPKQADGRTIFGYDEVEAAFMRVVDDHPEYQIQIGVDVARYGDNETVLFTRRGRFGLEMEIIPRSSVMDTVFACVRQATRWWNRKFDDPRKGEWLLTPDEFAMVRKNCLFVIDDAGVGGGVVDALRSQGWRVMGINNARAARNGRHYKSRGDEIWMVDGKIALADAYIPRDLKLQQQLCAREVRFDAATGTKRRLESKEEMAQRGLDSPDRADAVMLAFANVQTADNFDFRRAVAMI